METACVLCLQVASAQAAPSYLLTCVQLSLIASSGCCLSFSLCQVGNANCAFFRCTLCCTCEFFLFFLFFLLTY